MFTTVPEVKLSQSGRGNNLAQSAKARGLDPTNRPRRFLGIPHLSWKFLLVTILIVLGLGWAMQWHTSNAASVAPCTEVVVRANLPIFVTARGELESAQSQDVHCEVEGSQIKIVKILPEGSSVTKGTTVIEFDTKELDSSIVEREKSLNSAINGASAARKEIDVEKNRCESMISRAERDLQKAGMNREKYLDPKGEYQVQVDDLRAGIAELDRDLIIGKEKLELYRKSFKRGFSSAEQVRSKEQDIERLERRLDRDSAKLHLLETFTRKQQEAELTAQADDAARELERTKHNCEIAIARAEANAKTAEDVVRIEREALAKLKRQRELCTVTAPHDGILVYAKESDFDTNGRIRQGAVVYNNQKLFSLPDLTQMQVNVKVHESKVKRIEIGQVAEIRVDGHSLLHGTITGKASLPDSSGLLNVSGAKEYVSVVRIDDLSPDSKLLPRMSAEVRILVNELIDAILVPVQAVSESDGEYYSYVVGPTGVERRAVSIGESNEKFIEIKDGLYEGEHVTLDARVRIATELKKKDRSSRNFPSASVPMLRALPGNLPPVKDSNLNSELAEPAPDTLDQRSLPNMWNDSTNPSTRPANHPLFQLGSTP